MAQKQRYLERGIRKWKRRERIFKTAEDKEYYKKCKEKVKEWQLRNKEFTENNNLKRDFTRENVERVTKVQNSDTIKNMNKEDKELQYIGKIDKARFKNITEDITTDEVILTDRQVEHIKERHPNDYEQYFKYIKDIVENPDYIVRDTKPNTGFLLKEFTEDDKRFQLILRLHTSDDNKEYKNSIITFLKVSEKKYKQYLRNKEIIWKKLDKDE